MSESTPCRSITLVNQWSADHTHALTGGVPVLALDLYEHAYHIGRATALKLRAAGLNARFLRGGIDGRQAAGRALVSKGAAS